MYTDTELFYPYLQNFPLGIQQLDEYCASQKANDLMSNLLQASTISEYDLVGEGDLFKAPEPIIEEAAAAAAAVLGLDPMTAALSMISCGDEVMNSQGLQVADIESMQSEQFLNEVLFECEKDLMAKEAIQSSPVSDIKFAVDENQIQGNKLLTDLPFQKSSSSSSLSSMEWVHGSTMRPSFLDFPVMDFGYGMRRAFSENDIKTLGNGNVSIVHSPVEQPLIIGSCTSEARREKLSRYRNKKKNRNFGRKIKYACRKALADNQPRIRGRFAKSEESEVLKM